MKRAVITGLGAITPIGNNIHDYWNNLINGKSGADSITKFDAANHKTKIACEVKDFTPLDYLERSEIRKTDLYSQYALAAASQCIEDSGINLQQVNLSEIGALIATGIGGMETFEQTVIDFGKNPSNPKFNPFFITKMISNIATGLISIRYGLHGPSYNISSACASSNHALANALDLIRLGRAKAILAGGSEATITEAAIGGFNSMKALSTNNDNPQKASCPFDKARDGFVAGEGAGVIMIEELEHALERGAKIYCELAGWGAASDAYHVAAPHPEGIGASLAMQQAVSDSNIDIIDVDYINAHATSTPAGDISECLAIEHVFGKQIKNIQVSATKSMTGHLLGAAGAIESIACIKSIENNIVPPTINLTDIDPAINPDFNITPNKALTFDVNVALNNTFGFGGHTSTTVFKKFKD